MSLLPFYIYDINIKNLKFYSFNKNLYLFKLKMKMLLKKQLVKMGKLIG